MPVLILTSDLLLQSQLAGAAGRAECTVESATTVESLLERANDARPELVCLDLSHAGLDPASVVPQVKQATPSATIVAFAPHVHRQRLAAAEQAGCDVVLSRGQFHADMESLLREHAG